MTDTSLSGARARLLAVYLDKRVELIRFFNRRLRSRAAAEDVVQELYLRIIRTDPHLELKSEAAYLYRLGANLMLDRLRSERLAAIRDFEWDAKQTVVLDGEQVADEPGAERELAAKERLRRVIAIVDALPPRTAEAFRLHKFDGMTHPEVAEAMGISRSAVEKHISAALKALILKLK